MHRLLIGCAWITVLLVKGAAAQDVARLRQVTPIAYEAASVKPYDNVDGTPYGSVTGSRGGLFRASNITVLSLLNMVYGAPPDRIVGAPAWAATTRFAVNMTAPGSSMRDQPGQILKLLQDRFALQTHRETRDGSIYALTRLRQDRLGPGVTPVADPACRGGFSGAVNNWWAKCTPWAITAEFIAGHLDRPMADRTGLTGLYDVTLEYTPQPPTGMSGNAPVAGENISIFTAIRDQLGVKVDAARGPVEVIVIDQLERPEPD